MRSARRPGAAPLPALLATAALALGGCSMLHGPEPASSGEARRIQVVSTLVGGKNVYIPSTIAVRAGEPTVLSIYNTTDVPHGFEISALGVKEILPAGQELEIPLPALEGPRLIDIHCQLHTAHRRATLLVLPAD